MKNTLLSHFTLPLLAGLLFVAATHPTEAGQANKKTPNLAENKSEVLGFSSERLERLHATMQREVDQKQLAGVVTILARHGKVVEERTYGKKDIASGAPMTKDTIFRIFSMTKPVTGVAMMILYEEGKWHPSDPVSQYIPEFAHLKVFKGVDQSGNMILEDPVHPPNMRELMTTTAGFTYGFFGTSPVDKMYKDQQVLQSQSLEDMINKLRKIPLLYQPGEGLPTDYATEPSMPSGGGGMVSTAEDYLRFAQMLLNDGELDGVRILAPATVQLMTSNHLAPTLMTSEGFFMGPRPGLGWGYDCAVFADPLQADEVVGKGTFFWLGAADTWFWVDPANDLIFVGMTQRMLGPGWPNVQALSQPLVYQAFLKPRM